MTWLLGLTFLFPWNSILTIGDYYYALFPVSLHIADAWNLTIVFFYLTSLNRLNGSQLARVKFLQDYHPSRVFTLLYQLLSLIATLIFTWYEANVSTRLRVLFGYGPYAILLLLFIIVSTALLPRHSHKLVRHTILYNFFSFSIKPFNTYSTCLNLAVGIPLRR